MDIDSKILGLISNLRSIMEAHSDHLKCFCAHGVQLEGWLKGELLHFFDDQKLMNTILNFSREELSGQGRSKVDFRIEFSDGNVSQYAWLEVKHWLIGYQKGYKYDALFYFGDPSSVGIAPDIRKLVSIEGNNKYLLILTSANPGENLWLKGVDRFNHKFAPPLVMSLTNPKDFPDYYFLGLLRVEYKP